MIRSSMVVLVALGMFLSAARAEDKSEEQAREVVTQFLKAVKQENVNALMPTVAVPWLHSDLTRITEVEKLRKAFDLLFEKRDYTKLETQIKLLTSYRLVRDKTDEDERKLLDEFLGDDGYVVLLQIEHPDKRLEKLVLLVRITDGKGKVVGIKD